MCETSCYLGGVLPTAPAETIRCDLADDVRAPFVVSRETILCVVELVADGCFAGDPERPVPLWTPIDLWLRNETVGVCGAGLVCSSNRWR